MVSTGEGSCGANKWQLRLETVIGEKSRLRENWKDVTTEHLRMKLYFTIVFRGKNTIPSANLSLKNPTQFWNNTLFLTKAPIFLRFNSWITVRHKSLYHLTFRYTFCRAALCKTAATRFSGELEQTRGFPFTHLNLNTASLNQIPKSLSTHSLWGAWGEGRPWEGVGPNPG